MRSERRLVLVMGAVVFVDTMFYAAIAPLLPQLAHELHLSKLSAGVMTAGYPLGTLLGSLPGGVLAVRVGPRLTVYTGLALLAVSTLAFGFLHDAALLDMARFIEGVGGACSWAGALAWIVADAPAERRGALMGQALGAAIGGALFGPIVGTIASALGRGPAFSAVVVLSLLLILAAQRLPLDHAPSGQGLRNVGRALRDPRLLTGMWLVTLPAAAGGALNVLGPLRLHRFGATAVAIGATYLVAAALETAVSPAVGSLSDRRGRLLPLRSGLGAAIVLLLCFTIPSAALPLALLIIALDGTVGAFWAPAMAMLSDAAEDQRLDQALAAGLINLAWAAGMIFGAGAGGAIGKAAGDGLPMAIIAGLCAASLLWLWRLPPRYSP